jgi:hypothetical protein
MTDITETYWASIGRNTGDDVFGAQHWSRFQRTVLDDIERACGGTVVVTVNGRSKWNGQPEDTFLVLFTIAPSYVAPLRHRLASTARTFGQEAIGLVGGIGPTLVHAKPIVA